MKFPELETPRLKLIQLNEAHLDDLFAIYQEEESMKYWDEFPHKNKEQTRELLQLFEKRIEDGKGLCWGIVLKENEHKVIGTISYNRYRRNGVATIGYILAQKYWNKGIMTEALKEFIKYGFATLGVHRIEAHVEPGNVVSEKLLEKIGFQKEGLLRERHYYKGKHYDAIFYGLLKTDKRKN